MMLSLLFLLLSVTCCGSNEEDQHVMIRGASGMTKTPSSTQTYYQQGKQTESYSSNIKEHRSLFDLPLTRGGAGLAFDQDNNLYYAQMFGRRIKKLNPDTGEVLEVINQGVGFANDVIVAPDGTLYWTVLAMGTIFRRFPGGKPEQLYRPFSYLFTNGIALSDDGKYLYFSTCATPGNSGFYERNLETDETKQLGAVSFFCASTGMTYRNKALYAAQLFSSKIIKVDIQDSTGNPVVTDVTLAVPGPGGVAFDKKGDLYATGFFTGELFRIDVKSKDVNNNAEVVAKLPASLDAIAFDKKNRIFISSFLNEALFEVQSGSEYRNIGV